MNNVLIKKKYIQYIHEDYICKHSLYPKNMLLCPSISLFLCPWVSSYYNMAGNQENINYYLKTFYEDKRKTGQLKLTHIYKRNN